MMTRVPLENSNSLMILDKNQWSGELSKIAIPLDVALLSSWEQEKSGFQQLKPLVEKLIDVGCKYFVCAGKYSESLHDFIDDVILEMLLANQCEESSEIMTTWHDTDADDEVADFFIHSTNASNSLLVAFLDESSLDDVRLKKAILNLARSGSYTGL